LEKQHRRGPHSRTATEPRQDLFAQQGLDLKQQKSTRENRECKRQKTPRIGLASDAFIHDPRGNEMGWSEVNLNHEDTKPQFHGQLS
jgi:hypothetical protein